MNLNPVEVLKQILAMLKGTTAGRILPWAILIAGIGAAAAIPLRLNADPETAVFSVVVMFVLMAVAVVFLTLATKGGPSIQLLAIIFAYTATVIVLLSAIFLMTGYFFGWPRPFKPIVKPAEIDKTSELPIFSQKWDRVGEIVKFDHGHQDPEDPVYTRWSFDLDLRTGSDNPYPLMLEFRIRPERVGDFELGKPQAMIAGKIQDKVGGHRPSDVRVAAQMRQLWFIDEAKQPHAYYKIILRVKPVEPTGHVPDDCLENPTKLVAVTRNKMP